MVNNVEIGKEDIVRFKNNISLSDMNHNLNVTEFEMKEPNISFLIIVKNEERVIKRCINSILNNMKNTDEIIIVDTGSSDKTLEIINSFNKENIKVFEFNWNNDFSEARNFAKVHAKKDWVFFIDADEYLVEDVIKELKKYICILEKSERKNIFINPTIINTNDHIINGVTRIFKNNSKIRYKGIIHEYPSITGEEINRFAFESIQLIHDGYDENIINMENKIKRNIKLLEKMKHLDENIRWDYLYCRDGSYIWSYEELIFKLESLLEKWEDKIDSDVYYSAARDLIELYLNSGELEKAKKNLGFLKTLNVNDSDIFYFEKIISWMEVKMSERKLLDDLIIYRKSREKIDYGALHSNYYHIDFLISQLMWSQGELNKAFKIQKKLNEKGVFNYTIDFEQILNIASNVRNEV